MNLFSVLFAMVSIDYRLLFNKVPMPLPELSQIGTGLELVAKIKPTLS